MKPIGRKKLRKGENGPLLRAVEAKAGGETREGKKIMSNERVFKNPPESPVGRKRRVSVQLTAYHRTARHLPWPPGA